MFLRGSVEMESFSCFLEILEDFQSHLRGTFLDIFWSKGYPLKDKSLNYKTSADLISKHHFFFSKNVTEESFTTFLLSEVDLYYCERLYVLALKIIQDEIWFSLSTSFRKVKKLSDSFSSILAERNKHSLESCIKACNFSRVLMNQFGVFDGTSIFFVQRNLKSPFWWR